MKNTSIIQNPVTMAYQNMINDIKLLTFINDFVPKASRTRINRYKKKVVKVFSEKYPEEMEGFSKLMKFFTETEKSRISGDKDFIRFVAQGEKTGEVLPFMVDFHNLIVKAPEFICDMSIVFLVARFEDFLASIMKTHFLNKPESLISQKQMTIQDILCCKDLDELKKAIIEKELKDIFYESIDGVNKYLKTKFKFPLDRRKEWCQFREVFYRRNIIIHNNGYSNEEYNRKTGHTGKRKLKVDNDYLVKSFKIFFFYSKLVTKKFYDKKFNTKVAAKEIE